MELDDIVDDDFLMELALRLVENLPIATIVVQPDGRIIMTNRTMEILSGYLKSQLIGKNVSDLVPADKRSLHETGLHNFFTADPSPCAIAAQIEAQNNGLVDIEITVAPIPTRKGLHAIALLRRKSAPLRT